MDNDDRGPAGARHAPWVYRGTNLGRTLALSDGVFAFAMTLLVLGLALPAGAQGPAIRHYLGSSAFLSSLYAYLISFFVISLWWQGHHLVFEQIRRFNRPLLRLNVLFLMFIAVLPFTTTVLNASGSDPVGVTVFGVNQIGAGVSLGVVWLYAAGPGRLTDPDLPGSWRRYVAVATFATPVLFAVSILVAYANVVVAQVLWLGIFVTPLLVRRKLET